MSRIKRMQSLWYPDRFQGWGRKKNYFEGWYFKVVSSSGKKVFAFIPGISMDVEGKQHAFLQVLDGVECEAGYHTFESAQFQPAEDRFALQLGNNFFSAGRLSLDLPSIKGELRFSNNVPWPRFLYAPGIMGWFSFVPFMQCYHGIVSLNHQISGTLTIKGESVSFDGGKGYIEKDWGQSFPKAWIWLQTNHFSEESDASLTASVAHIPWLGNFFIGYIVGFWWRGKVHRFATYTGAMMKARLDGEQVFLSFKDRRYRLEIEARQNGGGELVSPIAGEMTGKVNESIQATSRIRFYKGTELLFDSTAVNGGLEIAGEVNNLLTDKWRR